MATLTVNSVAHAPAGHTYLGNVVRAARELAAALFAVTPRTETVAAVRQANEEVSLFRLYRMAGASDSVMPNLEQELRKIAAGK